MAAHEQVGEFEILHFIRGKPTKVGGNVASYFCTPDRRVIHAVLGPVNADTLLEEARWAIELWKVVAKRDLAWQRDAVAQAHTLRVPPHAYYGWTRRNGVVDEDFLHRTLAERPLMTLDEAHHAIFEGCLGELVSATVAERRRTQPVLEAAAETGRPLAFSPGELLLVSGERDGSIRIWNVDSADERQTLFGHQDQVTGVAFSPDGSVLASGDLLGTVMGWDVQSGDKLWTLDGHTGEITSLAFARDGKRLASGSLDATVKLWDLASGEVSRTYNPRLGTMTMVAFSADGRTLASSNGRATKLLKVPQPKRK